MLSDIIKAGTGSSGETPQSNAPVIFVDRSPTSDLLVGPGDAPVWPIRDADDWQALSKQCQFQSMLIEPVQGRPGQITRRKGIVTGLGGDAVQKAARLYAHLTGRRFEAATDTSARPELSRSAIVVTTFEHLNSKLLHTLYSNPKVQSSPGLICAADAEDLRRQVLVRSVLARTQLRDEPAPWTAVFPTATVGASIGPRHRVLDASSSSQELRAALSARSGLLAIATHCDGVDAFLGSQLAFCAIDAPGLPAGLPGNSRAPSCRLNGHCHRYGVSVPDFRKLGIALPPASVSAGILLLDTCFGTLASDAPIDAAFGLGRHFIENLEIGAIATTWELTLLDVRKLEYLVEDLSLGMTLGRAVARFNRSPRARRTATRLAVFGDPETRVAVPRPQVPRQWRRAPRSATSPPPPPPPAASPELRELGFSKAYLENGLAALLPQLATTSPRIDQIRRQVETAEHALACLRRYELSQSPGVPSTPEDAACAEQLREALVVDAYVRRPTDDWIQFAESTDWAELLCRVCAAPARVGVLAPRVPGVSRRRVVLCPRCGVTEDVPEHVQITLGFDRSTHACAIAGTLPDREWTGALVIRTRIEASNRMWMWPSQPDGRPCPVMQVPEALPAGPLKLAVAMVHRGWLAWSAQDLHSGETLGGNAGSVEGRPGSVDPPRLR